MKNITKITVIIITIFISLNFCKADNPAYTLTAQNFVLTAPNILDFDIYIKHTNPGVSTFEFAIAEYSFNYNASYGNGGTVSFSFAPGNNSDLPVNARPRKAMVKNSILRLSSNSTIGKGSGPVISSTGNGTRVTRVRLQTTASSFSGSSGLSWRNTPERKPNTTVIAFTAAGGVNITSPPTHTINSGSVKTLNLNCVIEGFYNGSSMVSDTATVFLRSSTSPYSKIDSAKSVLNSNGTGTFLFNISSNGVGYYIQVKHRNSIETWSASPLSFIGSVLSYDFTSAEAQAFGSNMKLVEGKWCFYSGDINQDGTIDASDLSDADNDALASESGYVNTDVTGDDFVDATDISIIDNNSFNSVSMITP
ncbi:MAG: hypothetical protein IPH77_08405 [Ignavibacteria bacterium]|nr:hypothetical protein [Ignavibacteria bacterium]